MPLDSFIKEVLLRYLLHNQCDGAMIQFRVGAYNRPIMSNFQPASVLEICARVKHLGYTTSGRVRLYGEEFEVVSEPFPEADGIAVHVKSRKDPKVRVLQLPATVIQTVKRQKPPKVA
jgi:hypothetical protein